MKKILIALVIATVAVIGLGGTANANPKPPGPYHRVFCRPIVGHSLPAFCNGGYTPIPRDPGTGQVILHHRQNVVIRITWPHRHVAHRHVRKVVPVQGNYVVVFNNGASFYMNPCRYEDGHRCVWDARTRGNHHGHSFVQLHRHWYYY